MALMLSIRSDSAAHGPVPPSMQVGDAGLAIGRAAGSGLVLPDPSSWVSSRHCTIERRGGSWLLTDTSTNGTMVNGQRIGAPHVLAEGDVIGIGAYRMAVSMSGVAGGATVAQPAIVADGDVPGRLLRQLLAGTAVLAANRAKARRELGVRGGSAGAENVLLAGGTPDAMLAKLLAAPPAEAGSQVAGALRAIDNHQRATLQAMQVALRATLDKLSPAAIGRVTGGDEAAKWRAYEAAFAGAASDAGFVELFARELGAAYERLEKTPAG